MKSRTGLIITSLIVFAVVALNYYSQEQARQRKSNRVEKLIKETVDKKLQPLFEDKKVKSDVEVKNNDDLGQANYLNAVEKMVILERKVLRTPTQNKILQEQLSNPELIDKSFDLLNDREAVGRIGLARNQKQRMQAAHFLNLSLEWKENPQLAMIQEQAKEYIVQDNLSEISDLKIRKSFAADKIELFSNMKHLYHEKGQEIESLNQSETNARLFRFANNFYHLNNFKGETK